ncbi:MAG: glutamine-hydrolyzing GMP synthase, partial [Bifidobacteriaceae bacterium]|nr:glutamine-hydrolyzing GMP synthase [Bifidobacteriaceae bacterium]
MNSTRRPVLVVDYGAQYAQLIARRVREARVYSQIVPHTMTVDQLLALEPAAVILSGGPASVYEPDAPKVDPALFSAGVPVLGICYGFQAMAHVLGGQVDQAATGEYGQAEATTSQAGELLTGCPSIQPVWMSHGVAVNRAPAGFDVLASTPGAPVAAFEDPQRRLYGLQWHPEVRHTPHGQVALENFLYAGAGLRPEWTAGSIISEQVAAIRQQVGSARAICGLSGGVDSAVAAALVQRAIGDQLTCVFVDHGLLRAGERAQVERDFVASTGARLVVADARDRFLAALAGVSDPETKRKIIGREFIRVFEQTARTLVSNDDVPVKFLVQGTLYPDVVESGGGQGAANIKSHHNVGGLPDDLDFDLVEPLRCLFKDEVRAVGQELGLPDVMVWRQPFPGPGLAIRIIGEVTAERL